MRVYAEHGVLESRIPEVMKLNSNNNDPVPSSSSVKQYIREYGNRIINTATAID